MKKVPSYLVKSLATRLTAPESDFYGLGDTVVNSDGRHHTYIDNGSNVLAVAHLDSAVRVVPPLVTGQRVVSPQLDDRLGVWALLDLLPALGAKPFDILLTTDEEIGQSTASDFKATKQYNWMFQFDRRGLDAVMYQYKASDSANLLAKYGWTLAHGSFSDICSLDHLGVRGFNFGTGYHNEHSFKCHANLKDTLRSAKQFKRFLDDRHAEAMPYVPAPVVPAKRWSSFSQGRDWQWINDIPRRNHSITDACGYCYTVVDSEWNYCPQCGEKLFDDAMIDLPDGDYDDWIIR